jgi:hypothetical protein
VEPPERQRGNDDAELRPAYYAARSGFWRDWWTLLHPPYTAWHLGYVVIGASLAPKGNVTRLLGTLLAFFFAVGLAAHALDELNGRPLRTRIPSFALGAAAGLGLVLSVALGVVGVIQVGWGLVPFLCIGPLVVVAYNLELFGGVLHNDLTFAAAWGGFPVLTAYVAQTGRLGPAPVLAAAAAAALSLAQRALSTPARLLRRRVSEVDGVLTYLDGRTAPLQRELLLAPLERALRVMSWAVVLLASSLAVSRFS